MIEPRVRVAVLMGGRSGEHEISRQSGWSVLTQLPRDRFDPFPVILGKDGRWSFPSEPEAEPSMTLPPSGGLELPEALRALLDRKPDLAFIAMHGPEGEDGRVQSLMQLASLPFTGSDADASSLAISKPNTKAVYRTSGIPVADDWLIEGARWREDPGAVLGELKRRFEPPYVLKTPRLGSSVGLDILPGDADLAAAIERLLQHDRSLLVEAFVAGRELTCGVLDSRHFGPIRPLPVLEVVPVCSEFFDFRAKYTPGGAREICPADIPEPVRDRIQALGLAAHRALGCRGFSRTDFIWSGEDRIVTLETNTIPGLTKTSLLPQQAAAAGISFPDLVAGMALGALEGCQSLPCGETSG
ncbi:MAG: D-alanine--D-alanine ligase [Polyangia bacterium]|jgi:D-alanine-D-alanine ligase|nr:D-alanine--D-alanine ligase [Polyangia bacterium]